jgi:hypothetical protein
MFQQDLYGQHRSMDESKSMTNKSTCIDLSIQDEHMLDTMKDIHDTSFKGWRREFSHSICFVFEQNDNNNNDR